MVLSLALAAAFQSSASISLNVDARQADRGLFFATERFDAKPGPLTLQYPNWMPGAHSPTGGQGGVLNFKILADGKPLPWTRDLADMSAVTVQVPDGAKQIQVEYTVAGGGSAHISRVAWFRLVWYPQLPSDNVEYTASLDLPADWHVATALPVDRSSGSHLSFKPASLTRLVDSPCLIGRYYRQFNVTGGSSVPHFLDVMADTPAGVNAPPAVVDHVRRIHEEAEAITGSHHYRDYHWLLSISDFAGGIGLEHHESSEDGEGADGFSSLDLADLLSHEYFHSFNGKFRRPIGLCTPDYQVPMKDDLLWVYEGLTQFMGQLLACRSGWWTPEQWREQIALNYEEMNSNRGREWRTLEDTAGGLVSSGGRGGGGPSWGSARRGGDYYVESTIVWLNVDMRIRELTKGQKSLMDFLHVFHGGPATGPEIKPYTFDDIVSALNEVAPYDWAGLLRTRVYELQPELSQEAFSLAGWKLVYNDTPNAMANARGSRGARLASSLGLSVGSDGAISDVVPGSPADKAMLCPGMTIMAIDGGRFTIPALLEAVRESPAHHSIKLSLGYKEAVREATIEYAGGLRYPHIVRDPSATDRLQDLLTPLSH